MALDTTPAGANRGRYLALAAKLAVTVGIFYVLQLRLDFGDVGQRLMQVDGAFLATAIVILFIQSLLIAWRWMWISNTVEATGRIDVPFANFWRFLMISLWFNVALPSSVGGDAVRIWLMTRIGGPVGWATRGVILDRVSALAAIVLLIAFTLPGLSAKAADTDMVYGLVAMMACVFAGLAVLYKLERLLARWRENKWCAAAIALSADARVIIRNPVAVVTAFVIHAFTVLNFYIVAKGMALPVGLYEVALVMPAVIFLIALPISISGWGVREGVMVVGLGLFGIDAASAVAVSVVFGLCATLFGVGGGVVWLLDRQNKSR